MSKEKRKAKRHAPDERTTPPPKVETPPPDDPHAGLRLPAHPPRKNAIAFVVALILFFFWFAYLAFVAWRG